MTGLHGNGIGYDNKMEGKKMKLHTDIVIIGGGVSGTMAAIAASRKGAHVSLIERGGCLGGMWTAGLVGMSLDSGYKNGLISEFLGKVHEELKCGSGTLFETQKYLLEQMCMESGVHVYLHSQAYELQKEDKDITSISVITKSGKIEFMPQIVIDATGDGDIAAMAGCGFDYGRASDGKAQPMSMIALISGLDERAKDYIVYPGAPFADARQRFRKLLDEIEAPYSIGSPSIQPLCGDIYILSANQEYGKSGCDVVELTEATLHARKEIYEMVRALRKKAVDIFGSITLVSTPECIGVREGRRIHGRYTVTVDDIVHGKEHEDAICKVRYWVDIHSLENDGGKGFTDDGIKMQPYDLPFRSLLPVDVDNLIVAGRCISGDFYAHASYRVVGNMAPVGEAAGKMAAKAVMTNQKVYELQYEK